MKTKKIHILLDMDNTLLSMECLNAVIETALSAQLHPEAIAKAMRTVDSEMRKGMEGQAKLSETIPARVAIAKQFDAPVQQEHFEIVSRIVPNTLTQSIVDALAKSIAEMSAVQMQLAIVSGGPQICVDAAAKELSEQLTERTGQPVHVSGFGSSMVISEDGSLDQLQSEIRNSKIETIKEIVDDPAYAIMLGDSVMDMEVYDAGAVSHFIAVGLWVRRPALFERAENSPYYFKVQANNELEPALHTALKVMQG